MKNIRPYKGQVLLKPKEKEKITDFGLILSSVEEKKPEFATVVSVGEGVGCKEIKPGADVLFNKHVPYRVEVDGQKFLLIDWREIQAIIIEE